MKKWFEDLDIKYKGVIHAVMAILILIVIPCCTGEDTGDGVYLLWLALIMLEIVLIVWSIKAKQKSQNSNDATTLNSVPVDSESRANPQIVTDSTPPKPSTESSMELEELILEDGADLKLKYKYVERLCFCDNYDGFKLLDDVAFFHEPENEYDSNTVAVFVGDKKIGLMYKGDCRDIILKCIKQNKYVVKAFVCKKDIENDKIALRIGFYMPIDKSKFIVTSLIKTGKKDSLTDEKRQAQVEFLSEEERVILQEDYECDGLLVISESGYELGELSQAVSERIMDNVESLDDVYAIVSETSIDDKLRTKVKIKIFLDV